MRGLFCRHQRLEIFRCHRAVGPAANPDERWKAAWVDRFGVVNFVRCANPHCLRIFPTAIAYGDKVYDSDTVAGTAPARR